MSGTEAPALKRSPRVHVQRSGHEEKGVSFRFPAYLQQCFKVKEFTCGGDTMMSAMALRWIDMDACLWAFSTALLRGQSVFNAVRFRRGSCHARMVWAGER